jgi:3-methylcrotonyl-CoA carboxylase alpha subunit
MSEKTVSMRGGESRIRLERDGSSWLVRFDDGEVIAIEVLGVREDGVELRLGDRTQWVPALVRGEVVEFSLAHELWHAEVVSALAPKRSRHADHSMSAPMPGQVLKIFVQTGDVVRTGDPLLVLDAMKMEHQIVAPYDGRVESIGCQVGELVQPGLDLISLIPEGPEEPSS